MQLRFAVLDYDQEDLRLIPGNKVSAMFVGVDKDVNGLYPEVEYSKAIKQIRSRIERNRKSWELWDSQNQDTLKVETSTSIDHDLY